MGGFMRFLTKLLSLFVIFHSSIHLACAMEDEENRERQRITPHQQVKKLPPRQYWLSCLNPINPLFNADPHNRPNKLSELIDGFNNRLTNQIPFLPGFHVYYQGEDGRVWIAGRRNTGVLGPQITVKLFDAGQRRTNFVVRGPEFNFSFAYTQNSTTESRKHPPLDFRIPSQLRPFRGAYEEMQEGHGGDQADSRDGMGYDPLNFMGQYKDYNEKIRNPLVRHQIRKWGGAYAEYAIAAPRPPLTMGGTFASEAYMFFRYVNNVLECYLFPNYPVSYYNNVRKYLPRDKRSDYLKFMDLFRIDLGAHVNLLPFIHTPQVTDEEIERRGEQNSRTANAIVRRRLQLVPQERQGFYPPQVIQAFYYRMALYLFEQGASLEMSSISHKLSLVERLIDNLPSTEPEINLFQPSLAQFWLHVSEDQVRNTFTPLGDKLQLFHFHTSAHQLMESDDIRRLQDKRKADEVYEQIDEQAHEEFPFEEDVDNFMGLVDKIPEHLAAHLPATFFGVLSNMLYDIYSDYGLTEPDLYGFSSADDVEEFEAELLEMDEEDRELVDTLRDARRKVLESAFDDKTPTQEELAAAVMFLQKMKEKDDQYF